MDQARINLNIINALIIVAKAIINLLTRQVIIFSRSNDMKMTDLAMLDKKIMEELVEQLVRMKGRI